MEHLHRADWAVGKGGLVPALMARLSTNEQVKMLAMCSWALKTAGKQMYQQSMLLQSLQRRESCMGHGSVVP